MLFNDPEHIIIEEIATVVESTRIALNTRFVGLWPILNYQFGHIKEFTATMQSMGESSEDHVLKYPCVYLIQPFTIQRGKNNNIFGTVTGLKIYIIASNGTITMKAADRMNTTFKPIIYPVYREFLNQLDLSVAFSTMGKENIIHSFTDRYQQMIINDAVDCVEISGLTLQVHNKITCTT